MRPGSAPPCLMQSWSRWQHVSDQEAACPDRILPRRAQRQAPMAFLPGPGAPGNTLPPTRVPPPPPPTRASTSSSQGPVVADPGTHQTTSQGQARHSRVTRQAPQAPLACTPRPPALRAPHKQARRHLPPVCATTGYGGGQQSGRPWDRTTAIRLAPSCRHKGECRPWAWASGTGLDPNQTKPPPPHRWQLLCHLRDFPQNSGRPPSAPMLHVPRYLDPGCTSIKHCPTLPS